MHFVFVCSFVSYLMSFLIQKRKKQKKIGHENKGMAPVEELGRGLEQPWPPRSLEKVPRLMSFVLHWSSKKIEKPPYVIEKFSFFFNGFAPRIFSYIEALPRRIF